jgi:MtN3 and saliva related transmembrane protein
MDTTTIIGLIAGFMTTAAFVPQVIQTWKTKKTGHISLLMYVMFCLGIALWLTYGFVVKDLPIILANLVTLILASVVLFMKIKYK